MQRISLAKSALFCMLLTGLPLAWNYLDASPLLWLYDGWSRLAGYGIEILFGKQNYHQYDTASLTNKTVWVTGASSGIGAAMVCELKRNNARHIILSARRMERMADVVEECHDYSTVDDATSTYSSSTTSFSIVPYDAMVPELTSTVVEQAIQSSPTQSIDMLILNSGIYQIGPALSTSESYRQKLFQTNTIAPIELSQSLMQQDNWKERGYGHIVVVSSMMAKGPHSLSSTYGATKAALKSYFQNLSTEEWRWLTITNVLPGVTDTNMWIHAAESSGVGIGGARPETGNAMTAKRVAQLTIRAISAPPICHFFFYEVWITKSMGLLYGFLSHYTPTFFYYANHLIAEARMEAYHERQMDMLEMPSLIRSLYKKVFVFE